MNNEPPFKEFQSYSYEKNNIDGTAGIWNEVFKLKPYSNISLLMKSGSTIDFIYWETPSDFLKTWKRAKRKICFLTADENIIQVKKKEVAAVLVKKLEN